MNWIKQMNIEKQQINRIERLRANSKQESEKLGMPESVFKTMLDNGINPFQHIGASYVRIGNRLEAGLA